MIAPKQIYCCGCGCDVAARLTTGGEIYPKRPELHHLPFWKCDTCKNYVGCHWKTAKPHRPLGNIPTKELRSARAHIHKILDALWTTGKIKRGRLYGEISGRIGKGYHTGEIKSIDEARNIYAIVKDITRELKYAKGR